MKIRPKEIPIFLNGGVPQWYLDRYGNRTSLLGWNRNKRYDYSDENLNTNGHRNAGTLVTAYNKNLAYTGTPAVVSSDILAFYNSDGNGMSALDFVNFYNKNAEAIRNHWALDQTYGASTAGDHNRLYRKMFQSRSDLSLSPGSIYNIGYLTNLENTEGSSTWLRRMDLYENEFDEKNPDTNRIHEITLKDGSKAKVYKKANGDIALLNDSLNGAPSQVNPNTIGATPPNPTRSLEELQSAKPQLKQQDGSVGVSQFNEPESKWKIFGDKLKNAAPDILDALRLAGNLHNNQRVYDAVLKGIRPNLLQTYNTYRQVVGDEATKQAYYRRGIAGQTKAGLAFTSDADRQMAYLMEAKRAADELKTQGDLADNAEIRRTSDESNQHAWGNVQRATEVANRNLIEMNNANAAKWNLKALKYSADWTNWDNYLMGIQNRWQQKKEEDKAFLRQLTSLEVLNDYINDDLLNQLLFNRQNLLEKYLKDGIDDATKLSLYKQILELNKQINSRKLELEKSALGRMYGVEIAKSGSKIEYKYKRDGDKYLYKTSRDVVEHFRAMSRMSDESRLKSRTRPIKLSSHPKGNTRKYLLGGVAPFTIYRPLGIGGESAISSQTTSSGTSTSKTSSTKDEAAKNKLDLVKELFKSLQGLPIDVNTAYSDIYKLFEKSKLFGEEMSTDDIAGIYLNSIRSVNLLKHSLEVFEKAKAFATSLDSLQEYAVTSNGHYIALDKEGNLTEVEDLKEFADNGLSPVTNQLLINMRAYSANMVGLKGDTILENVIGNGMGVNKIGDQIKALAGKIGTSESKLDGISQVESNKVKQGLQILAGAPDGYYKVTTENKTQQAQINAALSYIENMLSPSQRAILNAHGGTKPLIQAFLTSQQDSTYNVSILPLTGKASDKDKNDNGDGNMLPSVAFFNGLGEKDTFIILDKTSDGLKINVVSTPITSKGYNTGSITFNKLESSDFGGQLLMNQATMGDSLISSTGRNNIIIDGRIYLAELPIDQEAKRNGIIKPDLRFLKNIEAADAKLREMGIDKSDPKNINTVNKVYRENNLPILYTISNNKPTITSEYARFAIVNGIGTEDAFGENPQFNDAVLEVSSDKERQQFETMMQLLGNTKYKLDNGYGIGPISWGETKLYKGTVYIPMVTSNISALAGTGFKAKGEEYNLIEARQQAADAARNKGFVPAGDASNFK